MSNEKPSPVKEAPELYVGWWRERQIHKGAAELEKLVCEQSMSLVWRRISCCHPDERFYRELWGEIVWLLQCSRKTPIPRATEKAHYRGIGEKCDLVASEIEGSDLDVRLHQLLLADQMGTFGIQNWANLDAFEQHVAASVGGADWPTAVELLRLLARRAEHFAARSMTEPRIVERRTRDWRVRYFVRGLQSFLRKRLGGPHLATTARIAKLLLVREDLDVAFVRNAIR